MIEEVKELARQAFVFVPLKGEPILVKYAQDEEEIKYTITSGEEDYTGCFYGTGEESGEEYAVEYKDVDLTVDTFYELVALKRKGE